MKHLKKIWIKIVESVFPGTYEEYLEAKEIHKKEVKAYRKNPQFIIGMLLYVVPLLIVFIFSPGWQFKLIVLSIALGEMLIRDAISEHYCALINRGRKNI